MPADHPDGTPTACMDPSGSPSQAPVTPVTDDARQRPPFGDRGSGLGLPRSAALRLIPLSVITAIVPADRRASAYELFDTGFGIGWFGGSPALGFLYDASLRGFQSRRPQAADWAHRRPNRPLPSTTTGGSR